MLLIPVVVLLIGQTAAAELLFETTRASASPSEESLANARFGFRNASGTQVTVLAVEPLTEGLHAVLEGPRTLKPGETSAVRLVGLEGVVFEDQLLRARVTTDEPGAAPIELELAVAPSQWDAMDPTDRLALRERAEQLRATPPPLTIKPGLLVWRSGEPLGPKTVRITVNEGAPPVRVLELRPLGGGKAATAEVREVEPGRAFEVVVTPASDARQGRARWLLRTDLPEEMTMRQRMDGPIVVSAMIMRPPNTQREAAVSPDTLLEPQARE